MIRQKIFNPIFVYQKEKNSKEKKASRKNIKEVKSFSFVKFLVYSFVFFLLSFR